MVRYISAFLITLLLSFALQAQDSERDLGFDAYQKGDFVKAIEYFEKAVADDPDDRRSWMYLGTANLHLKKRKNAMRAFDIWWGLKPSDPVVGKFSDENYVIKSKPHASSNEAVRRLYTEGKARVLVELRADGKIGLVRVLSSNASEWEPEVLRAARGIKFEPATKNGQPLTTPVILEYTFRNF